MNSSWSVDLRSVANSVATHNHQSDLIRSTPERVLHSPASAASEQDIQAKTSRPDSLAEFLWALGGPGRGSPR